ncbi:type III secretion system ATPase SctN [Burkholderia ubonensis]|uniref:type III secretion system ATPase SctN n=1 Tax=Burkholderia ubonensis TaxID=101571 RepID=UPI00075439FF|nr:type III secretion system ATPase SctN [Burkholderia ubonensis]KVN41165.1 ATP synthase [Burkholderia ubonensis]
MTVLRALRRFAHPQRLSGPIIEATLPGVAVGELCEVRRHWRDPHIVARAQVVGFNAHATVLSLIGSATGLSRDAVLQPTGTGLSAWVGESLLGCVINPAGEIVERLAGAEATTGQTRTLAAEPPAYAERESIRDPLVTGLRAIDGLLTCGVGQRMGIFAAAGCGKTTLMEMLIGQADADVFVVGLIGERGREVREFVSALRQSPRCERCVVVYASSDFPSMDRCNAALLATTVAEYFRDRGSRVVLFVDSITRYARALRDVALAAGEAPARRGYPASVFDALPGLLERPGLTVRGSITAFYTVLLENEEEPDPVAEEIRSILDGHIYLSQRLAIKGHYPAIDVLTSISRIAPKVTDADHQHLAREVRAILGRLDELQVLLDLGEYRTGESSANDRALGCRDALQRWLCQRYDECSAWSSTLAGMRDLVA